MQAIQRANRFSFGQRMDIRWCSLFCIAMTSLFSGCSICPPGYLDDYATIGGRYQRLNPTTGRVGSVFSDPGTQEVNLHVEGVPAGEYYESAPATDPSIYGQSLVEPSVIDTDPPSFDLQEGQVLEAPEVVPAPNPADASRALNRSFGTRRLTSS